MFSSELGRISLSCISRYIKKKKNVFFYKHSYFILIFKWRKNFLSAKIRNAPLHFSWLDCVGVCV